MSNSITNKPTCEPLDEDGFYLDDAHNLIQVVNGQNFTYSGRHQSFYPSKPHQFPESMPLSASKAAEVKKWLDESHARYGAKPDQENDS